MNTINPPVPLGDEANEISVNYIVNLGLDGDIEYNDVSTHLLILLLISKGRDCKYEYCNLQRIITGIFRSRRKSMGR